VPFESGAMVWSPWKIIGKKRSTKQELFFEEVSQWLVLGSSNPMFIFNAIRNMATSYIQCG